MKEKIPSTTDKTRFLAWLTQNPNRTEAALKAGVSGSDVMSWIAHDPDFLRELRAIESDGARAKKATSVQAETQI